MNKIILTLMLCIISITIYGQKSRDNLSGKWKTEKGVAIEIIKKSILVVSPDTAIIHIADGFDKKIISFYKNEKITYDKWKISEDNEIHFYENNINELDFSNINL